MAETVVAPTGVLLQALRTKAREPGLEWLNEAADRLLELELAARLPRSVDALADRILDELVRRDDADVLVATRKERGRLLLDDVGRRARERRTADARFDAIAIRTFAAEVRVDGSRARARFVSTEATTVHGAMPTLAVLVDPPAGRRGDHLCSAVAAAAEKRRAPVLTLRELTP